MQTQLSYTEVAKRKRDELMVTVAELHQGFKDLGYDVGRTVVEDLFYDERQLTNKGKERLRQLSEVFKAVAKRKRMRMADFEPWVLWPDIFTPPPRARSK